MATNKVFIGYEYDNDKAAKDRLLGWDANKEFDFSSYDQSFGIAVDSPGAAAIKQELAARIGDASYFLYIVGKESFRSGWVAWEVRKAVELKKKLVAVKTDSIYNSPPVLQSAGASWSTMFNFDSIKQAIDRV
ncbi:MAG: TIR domain-containing protein [Deltaproteobacteria bacterium]|nr:TIR domain-containing protein [Deltaproteobacteria bacterium]MBI2229950.1 TIR domain-containing protein [Deltaproteobacteria bacterium]MBI2364979.1 TIR domain-containing protein [Deltaproteobacteria bacterium]